MSSITRRHMLKRSTIGALGTTLVPVASLLPTIGQAQDLPMIDPNDAQAKALQYVEQSPDETKLCVGCVLYQAEEGTERGPCAIFPGKSVAAKGWCMSFAPKPQ